MADAEKLWVSPSEDLALTKNDVHVWHVILDQPHHFVQELSKILSEGELARSRRFYAELDRKRFIICRGILRVILGQYLSVKPNHFQIHYQSWGKPYLLTRTGLGSLQFNLSHSQGHALYAFAIDREIGVDLEYIRSTSDLGEIAPKVFSAREYAILCKLPANMRADAFFACWTRKEAHLKAVGSGLADPLVDIEVSVAPDEPGQLLRSFDDQGDEDKWSLENLFPAPGYAAALAVEGHDWHLSCWGFSPSLVSAICH
jgi:4'-phosphopantetheinyl transferase